jgi:hypothetical protein
MVTVNNYKTSHKTLLSLVRWLANPIPDDGARAKVPLLLLASAPPK